MIKADNQVTVVAEAEATERLRRQLFVSVNGH